MGRKIRRNTNNKILERNKYKAIHDSIPADLKDLLKEINNKNDKEVMQYGK